MATREELFAAVQLIKEHCGDRRGRACGKERGMSEAVKDYPPYLDYPKPRKKQTNADRIRAMTDEKLAQWLTFIEEKILAKQPSVSRSELFADWLDWLRQEVSENG